MSALISPPAACDPDWCRVTDSRNVFWYGKVEETQPDGTVKLKRRRVYLGCRMDMADGSYWFNSRSGAWTQHNRLPVPVMAYGQQQSDQHGKPLWQGALVCKYASTQALLKALYDRPAKQRVLWCRLLSALMDGVACCQDERFG